MAMFNPNRGLMAQSTVNQAIPSQPRGGFKLMGTGYMREPAPAPKMTYAGTPERQALQRRLDAGEEPSSFYASDMNTATPENVAVSPPAYMKRPTPSVEYSGGGGTVSESYRRPLESQLESLANPFGADYLRSLEGGAIETAEQQYTQAQEQIRSDLARRGLLAGGASGLEGALMARARLGAAAARREGLMSARTQAAQQAAEFEMRKRQLVDAYRAGLMSDAQALSLLPSQVALGRAQAELAGRTVESGVSQAASQADRARAEADIARLDADQKRRTIDFAVERARNELGLSETELQAAKNALYQLDPSQWWNSPWWKVANFALEGLKTGADVYRAATGK